MSENPPQKPADMNERSETRGEATDRDTIFSIVLIFAFIGFLFVSVVFVVPALLGPGPIEFQVKIAACDLDRGTVVIIDKNDFNTQEYSRDTENCAR